MSSGVAVSDECKTYFEDIKKAKKYRYVVFYIKEEKSIVVESVDGPLSPALPPVTCHPRNNQLSSVEDTQFVFGKKYF